MECKHKKIFDLFNENISDNKQYWLFTELFVYLHNGKDYCDCNVKKTDNQFAKIELSKEEFESYNELLLNKLEIAESSNTNLKELLKSLEFIKVAHETQDGEYCPKCGRNKCFGHTTDCALSKALEETK